MVRRSARDRWRPARFCATLMISGLTGAVLAVLALLPQVGLAAEAPRAHAEAGAVESPDDADSVLADFGAANPQCRLWTNWQKLCSRTGLGGATQCLADPARSVGPSAPFCVTALGTRGEAYAENFGRLRASSLRFCERVIEDEAEAQRDGEPELCEAYAPERPFNGRRLSSVRHPWCETWADAESQREVCSEGVASGSCRDLAEQGYEHDRLLICTSWRSDVPCRRPMGGALPRRLDDGVQVGGYPSAEATAAFGTSCLD